MLDLSPTKLIIIFVVVVVLLGPKRLPQVARQLGAGWRKVVGFQQQIERELRESMPDLPSSQDIVRFARSPVSMLNQLAEFPRSPSDALVEDPGAPAPADPATDGATAPPADGAPGPGASNGSHWPEDPASGRRRPEAPSSGTTPSAPVSAPPAKASAPAPAGLAPPPIADLGTLATDDPTMN